MDSSVYQSATSATYMSAMASGESSTPFSRTAQYPNDHGIPMEVIESLCNSDLMTARGQINMTDVDKAFAQANKPESEMRAPTGCVKGCIMGQGFFETIARIYGTERGTAAGAWQGKCFGDGGKVMNRIELGMGEPVLMFPGKVVMGESFFAPGEKAAIVDYSGFDHEFTSFRDEFREIYPGIFLGKMYALPGTSLYGVMNIPEGSAPLFTINFLLFSNGGDSLETSYGGDATGIGAVPGAV
jgi:hypothetical protein